MTDAKLSKELSDFLDTFENEIDEKLRDAGLNDFIWVRDPEVDPGETIRGNCAPQASCGADRCKSKIDMCTVRYCHRRHLCAVNCQVAQDCAPKGSYCHGKQL
ncbi:hypothetical protein [Pseudovibrio exalbescens]|uniref:Uncharacterized protein n=1 Tax=Pseudovibrio exalbescens TaxID=197461 RepID=A0A1U7JK42_9HYPH|nr:hypothetical protein [Pseudovibrio exalbescens]OKL45120.1 hypothetical protein A3843_05035 [Pseudovibrio exalbescens]